MNTTDSVSKILLNELAAVDGLNGFDNETGLSLSKSYGTDNYLAKYTTKLFGAPFQLLNSVDKRFDNINPNVGNEYLRNILLNSPILYVHPGMPRYTGNDKHPFTAAFRQIVFDRATSRNVLTTALVESILFGLNGEKLQNRMFGFKQTYLEYMSHVNYMCRSAAIYLNLYDKDAVDTDKNPIHGTFVKTSEDVYKFSPFTKIRWENYRMINRYVQNQQERLSSVITSAISDMSKLLSLRTAYDNAMEDRNDVSSWETQDRQLSSVAFMVEPVSFQESLGNETAQSLIESMIGKLDDGIGSEIQFITGSNVDLGPLGGIMDFLGDSLGSASKSLADLVEPVTGGFATGLFRGAIAAVKGQKMIYPDIYKSSSSNMDYSFSITLTSPYGDNYNYYMNIIVPLLHLIGLVAPRMVSANTLSSPFLVQAYIPGQCTCQLGIIDRMTITKNPTTNHVSVNGFPLTVKVDFTIKELYNAMSISPANDPASFLSNETLNDYLMNMAGMVPSLYSYSKKRDTMFKALADYFTPEEIIVQALSGPLEWIGEALQ